MAVKLPESPQTQGAFDLGAGDEESAGEALFAEINITPFTDVILVLLIIFMVSSSALVDAAQQGHLDVTLPQAGHARTAGEETPTLVIGLTQDGRIVAHDSVISSDALETLLTQTHLKAPDTAVIVDADGGLPHQRVVKVIDAVRAAGFATVGIGAATDP